MCRRDKKHTRYVFYTEDAQEIMMNLSGSNESLKALAVDTRKPYEEIDLDKMSPEDQTWQTPYESDWAVAIGNFNE